MRFPPEVELLLCCARTQLGPDCTKRLREIVQQEINWGYVGNLASRNRVRPLCYANLRALCPNAAPPETLEELRQAHEATGLYNLFLTLQLVLLLRALDEYSIQAIPYKGIAIAETMYSNLALREVGDLDLVVRRQDVLRAACALRELGYVQTWPAVELDDVQRRQHMKTKYNFTYHHIDHGTCIELHWGITPAYLSCPPETEWLWRRLQRVKLAGHEIWAFPVEELLLILCIHGANHCWNRLAWLCDIAELLHRRGRELDWDYLLSLAHQWRAERILLLGLCLAAMLLDSDLPPAITQKIEGNSTVTGLAYSSCQHLFSQNHLPFAPFEEPLYHLKMRERRADRIRYALAMLIPSSKDHMWAPLPRPFHFLFYVLRPLRLGVEHGLRLIR